MTINEVIGKKSIKPASPLTPDQARIDSLKKSKDAVSKNLKLERNRQRLIKAQKQITSTTSASRAF